MSCHQKGKLNKENNEARSHHDEGNDEGNGGENEAGDLHAPVHLEPRAISGQILTITSNTREIAV